ncbi:hypothetical protein QR90_10935 [Deinococcus radiopugnans]|uniref:TMEM205-like domain-containing protein n=1 Tax=Deinococcus radiopugnans TaxID=57497 RepID=A0A0A7KH19_9DEIO|nr:DUF4149 domain-containing protein [Deinococcus radiopugnans]AIZ45487.1 hypothetical protein QR90_10935 [Deinococcus radiopugnans]
MSLFSGTLLSWLAGLNILLVGLWVGMYLFTTFVVSPAFTELFPDAEVRRSHRRLVGRHYARVNGPLTGLLGGVALVMIVMGGAAPVLWAELLLLALIGGTVALHVRRASVAGAPVPGWITNVTLGASVLLCVAAVGAA